nr:immunoglobulin light chain junction region [Macaca mulatta]MOW65784.1 immunoglobulin light chain junction region [Macaca mulatta]
CQKYNSSPWTF